MSTPESRKDDWHVFTMIVAVVLALAILGGGVGVGCSAFLAWNAHNGVNQVKNDARTGFYSYCQRSLKIGRVDPRCPR